MPYPLTCKHFMQDFSVNLAYRHCELLGVVRHEAKQKAIRKKKKLPRHIVPRNDGWNTPICFTFRVWNDEKGIGLLRPNGSAMTEKNVLDCVGLHPRNLSIR